jgi:hypothetical protein
MHVYIYILYIPRTVLYPLPSSFRKGSEAALIWHVTEHRGGMAEPRGATGERAGAQASHKERWP